MGACDTAQRQTTQQAAAANATLQVQQEVPAQIDPNVPAPNVSVPQTATAQTAQVNANQNTGFLGGLFNNQQQQDNTPMAQTLGNKAGDAVYSQLQQRGYVGGPSDPNSTMSQVTSYAKNIFSNYNSSNATATAATNGANTAAQAGFGEQFKTGFVNAFSK